jgi:hypothetical protein
MAADRVLGLLVLAFALLVLFVWIPFDVESGVVETHRRQTTIGDAMMPTVLSAAMAVFGALLAFRPGPGAPLNAGHLRFVLALAVLLAASLAVMMWTGPVLVALTGAHDGGYRPLRDALPWKLTGFVLGGWLMLAGSLAWLGGGFSLRRALLAAVVVIVLVALVDLPFDDLLLPPNGDY